MEEAETGKVRGHNPKKEFGTGMEVKEISSAQTRSKGKGEMGKDCNDTCAAKGRQNKAKGGGSVQDQRTQKKGGLPPGGGKRTSPGEKGKAQVTDPDTAGRT